MATAEHREPCDSRGSCTVLGAPGGEIPPGDSSTCEELTQGTDFRVAPNNRRGRERKHPSPSYCREIAFGFLKKNRRWCGAIFFARSQETFAMVG